MAQYKYDANTDFNSLTVFDMMAFAKGSATMDKFHFFNIVKEASGEDLDFKKFIGGTIPKVLDGKRIPMNKMTNNPALTSPSVAGMKYFGQFALVKNAVDQIFPKRVGVFPTATHGAGMNAFDFQNSSLMSGEDTLQNIVGKILFAGQFNTIKDEQHQLFQPLKGLADQIGKAGGADSKTKINPASDTSRLLQMCAAGFAGGQNPFSGSALGDGVSMAKEVMSFIKKLS